MCPAALSGSPYARCSDWRVMPRTSSGIGGPGHDPRRVAENHKGGEVRQRSTLWVFLSFLWAAYYLAVFSIGRYPEYTRGVIWYGGGAVVLLTAAAYTRRPTRLPREGLILLVFLGWTLTGTFFVVDWPAFLVYFRMIAQMTAIVICVGLALRKSGGMNWFHVCFLLAVAYNILAGRDETQAERTLLEGLQFRHAALTGNPNALGFYSVIGLLGALALLGAKRPFFVRGCLVVGAGLSVYGVVAAASRGAFLAMVLSLVLWPIMCLREGMRDRRRWLVLTAVLLVALLALGRFILDQTLLGERLLRSVGGTEEESELGGHVDVRVAGLKVLASYPLTGVGLGQFPIYSGTGAYAHNELIEVSATTGIVGLLIYMGVYWSVWRRLGRLVMLTGEPTLRYRANFARMVLVILVFSGAVFRPNFIAVDSIFLLAFTVGTVEWLDQKLVMRARFMSAPIRGKSRIGPFWGVTSPRPGQGLQLAIGRSARRWAPFHHGSLRQAKPSGLSSS